MEVPKNTRLESKSEDKVTVEIGNLVTAERNIEVHEKESLPEKTVLVKSKPDPEKVKIYGICVRSRCRIHRIKAFFAARKSR